MAHKPIREYDAKKYFFESIWKKYTWLQIQSKKDLENLEKNKKYVIKPDELFGKRGKYGLLGIDLDTTWIEKWFEKYFNQPQTIGKKSWILSTFLVEEFIPHTKEYYVSIKQERDFDEIFFSSEWGIDIEENWEKVLSLKVWVWDKISLSEIEKTFQIHDEKIVQVILDLFVFYREKDFVYLEVNPFCFDERNEDLVLLDMVAKVDDSAFYLQKNIWWEKDFPKPFWEIQTDAEQYIWDLDRKTGASLKYTLLNPEGKIWTLFSGGGGSLVLSDTLGFLWFWDEIANYGEISWDPDRNFTFEYTKTIFWKMFEAKNPKYLIIGGAIANFTQIDKTFAWIIDAIEIYKDDFLQKNIQILVRRWWLNDIKWLKLLWDACKKWWISCKLTGSESYMTDILHEIKL